MTMVAQKFKILLEKEKRTVRGSAVAILSDTKLGFTVPSGKQTSWENSYATFEFTKILLVYFICV